MENLINGESIKMGTANDHVNINPHLRNIKEDTLYHIGLTHGKQDLKKMFGDVKVNSKQFLILSRRIDKLISFEIIISICCISIIFF